MAGGTCTRRAGFMTRLGMQAIVGAALQQRVLVLILGAALPNAAQPMLSPTSPIGEIFRYRVVGPPGYTVTDLKTIQDWILLRRFKAVPGVIDVTSWGGKSKTYDITVDLDRLLTYGLTLKQVIDALNGANINVGANTVNLGPQSAVIRSVGQIRSVDDIKHTMVVVREGAPVLVRDVAAVA